MKQLFALTLITIFIGCSTSEKITTNNNKTKDQLIVGKWNVVASNVIPFEHPSFCEKLELNSVFEFKKDHSLNVYEKEKGKKCTTQQQYSIYQENLKMIEGDMVFMYEIKSLTSDTLKLRISALPDYFNNKPNQTEKNLEQIKKDGVLLTLIKK